MTRPESEAPDRAFSGAHSSVSGAHTVSAAADDNSATRRRTLSLESAPGSAGHGWSIRLPVRAEEVTVSKDVVVRERVVVRRQRVADVARVAAEVRREELRTSSEGTRSSMDGEAEAWARN